LTSISFAKFLILANVFLGESMLHNYAGAFPRKEGSVQVLAGLGSSYPNSRILIENPWSAKPAGKFSEK
jgi:hypothetical protein